MHLADRSTRVAVRALNFGGRLLGSAGFTPPSLRPEALIAAARRRTGLAEFGSWPFREPLQRLLDSYEHEARLTLLGRVTVRELIISLLETLLNMEAERARCDRVETQRIEAPVFIIGLPRTGTTLLHGLMSEDPANRVPRTWEVMYPANYPSDAEGEKQARRRAATRLAWANRLAPEFKRIHPLAPDLPQECIAITAPIFMSIQFHTTHALPSYEDWLEADGQHLAYQFHHRLLQHLQARRSEGRHWVLKAPGHLFALGALLDQYPDATIIQTHRDPLRVMASMASHATVLRRAFSDEADPQQIASDWAARWGRALHDFLEVRDRADRGQFLDLSYEDITRSPLAVMERIYAFLGRRYTDEARTAMARFLRANPKDKHGVHRYSLEQYGLDRATELARFKGYCERFRIAVQT